MAFSRRLYFFCGLYLMKIYMSTDDQAPVLGPQSGSMNQILKACLINGYGSRSPAGWTLVNDLNNVLHLKNINGKVLRSDDQLTTESHLRGFSSDIDLNNEGMGFPSRHQLANGYLLFEKLGVEWTLFANNRIFYLICNDKLTSFGTFITYNPDDVFNTLLIGEETLGSAPALFTQTDAAIPGHYVEGSSRKVKWSVKVGKHSDPRVDNLPPMNMSDGSVYIYPIFLHEPDTNAMRGLLPDLWVLSPLTMLAPNSDIHTYGSISFWLINFQTRTFAVAVDG